MPLNKLENFIKNTEGRILYVNPSDLDATDSVTNQGNSLSKPFKTIQRALIEAARFSYIKDEDNDIVEKTTILLFPGEHIIDNRPGYGIKNVGGNAKAVTPGGSSDTFANNEFALNPNSNFDLNQRTNLLYKFNSVNGGVIVPRGISIVGLDLRKTKIRPTYIPNPTDPTVKNAAIFRVTGGCYFWQFSILDGDETKTVYSDPINSTIGAKAVPTFSHHKLTAFEYADGVNLAQGPVTSYDYTDLDMYYYKLSNAYNEESNRQITPKFPQNSNNFSKQRPEWEIVGAFATDPIDIELIESGDPGNEGEQASSRVIVTTKTLHNLSVGTPIKIRGVSGGSGDANAAYNISTKVTKVLTSRIFEYYLPPGDAGSRAARPDISGATVTIETDTVSGASPYIFNVSLRSIWGMNGLLADGKRSSGFRSMVVAQFTAISLQKDDRAFVEYNPNLRTYEGVILNTVQKTNELSAFSSQTNPEQVYHLKPNAVYRKGWQTSHIKMVNDAFVQIVSVFAIGFNKHFDARSGGDGSITNSNSNFGQISLSADGFKREAFDKDDKIFITSIVAPKAITNTEIDLDWVTIDVGVTTTAYYSAGISSHLYLFGYKNPDVAPPIITQGYRIGARKGDILYVTDQNSQVRQANIYMLNNDVTSGIRIAEGTNSSEKNYSILSINSNVFKTSTTHKLVTGEKIRIISDIGDLPENVREHIVYYAISDPNDNTLFKLATSFTNAVIGVEVKSISNATTSSQLRVVSRVSDKIAGERGHPIQYDTVAKNWYIHTNANSDILSSLLGLNKDVVPRTDVSFFKRIEDGRSLDEKLYKLRAFVPKQFTNARDPIRGYVLQESSSTGARSNLDFTNVPISGIGTEDYGYNRNTRFISSCTYSVANNLVTIVSDLPHRLKSGNLVTIRGVTSFDNTEGSFVKAYNGTFSVQNVPNDKIFTYIPTDIDGVNRTLTALSTCTNNFNSRTVDNLPRFEKNDNQGNLFVYRSEVISPYIENDQDGIYYFYAINSSNSITNEFTDLNYTQNVVDLYPQADKDNINDNPPSAVSFAKRSPLGDVVTNDLKNSITRETIDKFYKTFDIAPVITAVSVTPTSATLTLSREHGFAGIATILPVDVTAGAGYTNGTYYNVKLYNNNSTDWDGASANVTVSSNQVNRVQIVSGGSGYQDGERLVFEPVLGAGGVGAAVSVRTAGISTNIGDILQITGVGTVTDAYYRITGIGNTRQVSIARTSGDPIPLVGQYIINNGPAVRLNGAPQVGPTGIATFNCFGPHGLVVGNRVRITGSVTGDTSNPAYNFGDYIVNERVDFDTFSVSNYNVPTSGFSPTFALKNALASNALVADVTSENLSARNVFFYDNDYIILGESVTTQDKFKVSGGISTTSRFPLGTYIQIDDEIMRVKAATLDNSGRLSVLRGVFGTNQTNHDNNSLVRKIKPIPVELRRPSIIRASGHTFEYLGYGPGNYSTGLPQVQLKTLTEREDFLAQSQETACGSVVYTGMNNEGDFFIGNTKYSATSGEQKTFEIPVPTVTGQEASLLSVVYDEAIIKERLVVEGGNSGTVLSQFDGPTTFTKEVQINGTLTLGSAIKSAKPIEIVNVDDSTSTRTGALIIAGGLGIGKTITVGGNAAVSGITSTLNVTDATTNNVGSLVVYGGAAIKKSLNVGFGVSVAQNLFVSGFSTFFSNVRLNNNIKTIYGTTGNGSLQVYTDGTDGFVDEVGSGNLKIRSNSNVIISNETSATTFARFSSTLAELYYNNTKRLETSGVGVTITGELQVTSDIIAYYTSDERLKNNIKPIEDPLAKVLSISGNTFDWNAESQKEGSDVGVIAQEIQKVLPEAVTERENGYLAVRYEKIVPLLIEAIKELKSEIDELKNQK